MDPLSIAASSIAIVDFLKESIRHIKDVIAADKDRQVLRERLDYVDTVTKSLDTLLKSERNHPGQPWMLLLDPNENEKSPLKGLKLAVEKLINALDPKNSVWRHKIKNLDWHNEKDDLEALFVEINGFCAGIGAILVAANIEISRNAYSVASETNLIRKKMAAEFDLDREETRKAQEQTMRLQVEKEKRREEAERKEIERWLSPLDFQARQREILDTSARTGKHFIESPEFLNWEDGGVRLLRCYGPSGAGKPPQAIDQIRDRGLPEGVKDAYKKATRINARMTQNEMRGLLEVELESHDNVYLVVDALDEASQESRDLVEKSIRGICPEKLKLMTTRREDEEFSQNKVLCNICREECEFYHNCLECPQTPLERKDLCQSCRNKGKGCPDDPSHELAPPKIVEKIIATSNEDLEIYIRAVIKDQMPEEQPEDGLDSPRRSSSKLGWECHKSAPLLNDIVTAIVKNSKGRFLLAKQYARSLGSKMTLKAIKKAVKEMQEDQYSPSELIDKNYDEDMAIRIKGQESEKVKVALRILAIISTARRNLKLKELQHALATEEGDTEYDPEGQLDRQEILNLTKGLVRIDRDQNKIVRLDHLTLEEYFEKTRDEHFPAFEIEMAKIYLNYLNLEEFSKPCDEIEEFSAKEDLHALLSYAVQYWGDHETGFGRTALSLAAEDNQSDTVELLLMQGADPTAKDMRGGTAIPRAAEEGSIEALQKLIDFGISLECADEDGRTPFHWASENGHTEVLELLKEKQLSIDCQDRFGMTPLHCACSSGALESATFLLESGASQSIKDKFERTPLIVAQQYGHEDLISIFQENKTDEESESTEVEGLPLWSLVKLQKFDMIVAAIEANQARLLEKEPGTGSTAIHCAIIDLDSEVSDCDIQVKILRALVEAGTQYLDEPDDCGRSPLHVAALNGSIDATQSLLEYDPQLNRKDRFGLTPLAIAFRNTNFPVAVMLIDAGADIPISQIDLQKMLFKSIELQSVQAVKALVSAGADATAPDEFGRTANQLARLSGDSRLMRMVQSIKSFISEMKRAPTTKACTDISVVEVFDDAAASQVHFRPFQSRPFSAPIDLEESAICA